MKLFLVILASFALTQASTLHGSEGSDGNVAAGGTRAIIGDREYFFGTTNPVNALGAGTSCLELNMTLVSLQSEEETQMLYGYMVANGMGTDTFWTSGRRIVSSWMWACGEVFTYLGWGEGQPNYTGGGDPCVILNPVDGWSDFSCTSLQKFICEQK